MACGRGIRRRTVGTMSRNVRVLKCTPEDVFRVLGDGWLYPSWVVGASRMREVDESWPSAGAKLHHSVGVWPALIDDSTTVEASDPPRRIVMKARGWPLGEARVTIDVKARGDGSVVRIQEEAVAGPATYVPTPVMDLLLRWRNAETLHRLAYLAEGMAAAQARVTTAQREMAQSGEKALNGEKTQSGDEPQAKAAKPVTPKSAGAKPQGATAQTAAAKPTTAARPKKTPAPAGPDEEPRPDEMVP